MLDLRDPVSSLSHFATAVWAVFATLLLLRLAPPGRRFPLGVYGLSMIALYSASGTFHALHFRSPEERLLYQKIDQSAIYLLIAGTNTPILTILLEGRWRRWLLSLIWGIALAGVACQWLFPKPPYAVIVGLCLGLGWVGVIPLHRYYGAVGWRAMNWVWLGSLLYTAGGVFELTRWPTIIPHWVEFHDVMHFCDSAATLVFFLFVVRYVLPFRKAATFPLAHISQTAGIANDGAQDRVALVGCPATRTRPASS